ncbi:MAG: CHAT domain-containing protein [Gemmatimonadaceae bacterium]|nr:CHAT domain-containing protein [Gemmatimonadaceae bacterium]MCW5827444.1 CHAT domain-containing protein [Gemmatimonadaceae bacterium]
MRLRPTIVVSAVLLLAAAPATPADARQAAAAVAAAATDAPRLVLTDLQGTPLPTTGGSRVYAVPTGTPVRIALRGGSVSQPQIRVWRLVGINATEVWNGSLSTDAERVLGQTTVGIGTDLLLLQWGASGASEALPMESERSHLYYLVADSARRAAPLTAARAVTAPMPSATLEAAFDQAAEDRKEAFEQVLATRSMTRTLIGVPNYRALRVALQEIFAPGTAMVMYAPAGDTLVTWMIAADGRLLRHIEPDASDRSARLETLRRAMRVDALQAPRTPQRRGVVPAAPAAAARPPSTERALRDVAALLLPRPLHAALRQAQHLVIVPALDIGATPFAALPHPRGGQVVDHASVVIAPSICDVLQLGHRVHYTDASGNPLVVGDPTFPDDGEWLMPPLPGARTEAEAIAARLGAVPLVGDAATPAAVRRRVADASLLYFATHGIASDLQPMDGSFLQLAAVGGNHGRYTARDIQAQRVRARLAVLSACQTGLGAAHDGGIIGVARSFINAGSSQVVMSLWNVDDEATTQLMTGFIAQLEVHPPPEALRRAMVALRDAGRSSAAPVYWASFAVFGATW